MAKQGKKGSDKGFHAQKVRTSRSSHVDKSKVRGPREAEAAKPQVPRRENQTWGRGKSSAVIQERIFAGDLEGAVA